MQGRLSIVRPSNATQDEAPVIRIYLADPSSHKRVLKLTLSAEDFALAITGLSDRPCEYTLTAQKA